MTCRDESTAYKVLSAIDDLRVWLGEDPRHDVDDALRALTLAVAAIFDAPTEAASDEDVRELQRLTEDIMHALSCSDDSDRISEIKVYGSVTLYLRDAVEEWCRRMEQRTTRNPNADKEPGR